MTTTMNPERGRLWVEGLRSDEYTQGRGSFVGLVEIEKDGSTEVVTTHCCLAVAADVAIKNGCDTARWITDSDNALRLLVQHDPDWGDPHDHDIHEQAEDGTWWVSHQTGDLPNAIIEWLDLEVGGTDESGRTATASNPPLDGVRAINRNDSNMDSYGDIADAIENDIAAQEARA